jgi:hypothetical protein
VIAQANAADADDERLVLVERIFALYQRASAIDPQAPSPAGSPLAIVRAVETWRELLAETLAAVTRLQKTCDAPVQDDTGGDDWGDHLEHTNGGDETPSVGRTLDEQLWSHVGDMCFTAGGELRKAERGLRPIDGSGEERLAACESARRKLRRATVAIVEAAGRALGREYALASSREADTEAALAVRRMYAKFRAQLVRCDTRDPSSVRRALRHAAVSLAKMVGCDDFSDVRASDRALLLGLQARILAWARAGASESVGVRLYLDIVATSDLLRSINLRQELQTHDARVLAELEGFSRAPRARRELATLVRLLRSIEGRDEALDALLGGALAGDPLEHLEVYLADALSALGGHSTAQV